MRSIILLVQLPLLALALMRKRGSRSRSCGSWVRGIAEEFTIPAQEADLDTDN